MKISTVIAIALLLIGLGATSMADTPATSFKIAKRSGGACNGVERWSVKTGTDADISQVKLDAPEHSTIESLVSKTEPTDKPADARDAPVEVTVYELDATLVQVKEEPDQDYHLVITDNGKHMIAEIPDPACVGSTSPVRAKISAARQYFDNNVTVSTSHWTTVNRHVRITGIGFFDLMHGTPQRGVAKNNIEIHPVLDIQFKD